jgi:hypothetical protein
MELKMKPKSLIAAALLLSSATLANAADTGGLKYLSAFDPIAIRMLSCADILAKDGKRLRDIEPKQIAQLSKIYSSAGRAAVVRAALEAPGAPPAPKVANISFESKDAKNFVTNDLRVHEARAAEFMDEIRASGFDITSSCVDARTLDDATKLNEWFAHDTSVLTKVK